MANFLYLRKEEVKRMAKRFIGGKSTEPEVAALMALSMTPGATVTHETAAQQAGLDPSSNRFLTVTQAWRKRLRKERGVEVVSRSRVFVALTPGERVSARVSGLHRIGRATARETVATGAIPVADLSDREKAQYAIIRRHAAALLSAAQNAANEIAAPSAISGSTLRIAR